jgi:hypothetical protein
MNLCLHAWPQRVSKAPVVFKDKVIKISDATGSRGSAGGEEGRVACTWIAEFEVPVTDAKLWSSGACLEGLCLCVCACLCLRLCMCLCLCLCLCLRLYLCPRSFSLPRVGGRSRVAASVSRVVASVSSRAPPSLPILSHTYTHRTPVVVHAGSGGEEWRQVCRLRGGTGGDAVSARRGWAVSYK